MLKLALADATIGQVTFGFGGESRSFTSVGNESSVARRLQIRQTLESLPGIGTGNVAVIGTAASGYRIEFTGARAGEDLSALTVSLSTAAATSTVAQVAAAGPGQDEIKYLTFELPRVQPAPIDVAVETVTQPTAATVTGTGTTIYFSQPYNSTGHYDLKFGGRTVDVRYAAGGDVSNNAARLREKIATLLNTSQDNVAVEFDQNFLNQHRYFLRLTGSLSGRYGG